MGYASDARTKLVAKRYSEAEFLNLLRKPKMPGWSTPRLRDMAKTFGIAHSEAKPGWQWRLVMTLRAAFLKAQA